MIDIEIFFCQLVFDNYTATPRSSDALPVSSYSRKASADDFVEDSSDAGSTHDLDELRQQLQSMKKQVVVIMEQSRKSSEREKIARQQAQEAITLKEAAVAEAAEAASRENYMLGLMTDASLDMAGMLPQLYKFLHIICLLSILDYYTSFE